VHEPDGRDAEGGNDRDHCCCLRLCGETASCSPITHDAAKEPVLHQPPIESIGGLGEQKRSENDRSSRWDTGNDDTDERNADPEPPEGHEDETERTVANDDHDVRLENTSPDSVSAVELAHA